MWHNFAVSFRLFRLLRFEDAAEQCCESARRVQPERLSASAVARM